MWTCFVDPCHEKVSIQHVWQQTGTTTTTTTPGSDTVRGGSEVCLPEVFWAEGSVQIRVHISGALLHSLRVGDERFGLDPFPLYLRAILHPQVHKRHAWHLVPVRASENSHSPGLAEARAVVVRRHVSGCQKLGRVRVKTRAGLGGFRSRGKVSSWSFAASPFKCLLWLRAYVTCPRACCGQSPCVKCAEWCATSRVAGETPLNKRPPFVYLPLSN